MFYLVDTQLMGHLQGVLLIMFRIINIKEGTEDKVE